MTVKTKPRTLAEDWETFRQRRFLEEQVRLWVGAVAHCIASGSKRPTQRARWSPPGEGGCHVQFMLMGRHGEATKHTDRPCHRALLSSLWWPQDAQLPGNLASLGSGPHAAAAPQLSESPWPRPHTCTHLLTPVVFSGTTGRQRAPSPARTPDPPSLPTWLLSGQKSLPAASVPWPGPVPVPSEVQVLA